MGRLFSGRLAYAGCVVLVLLICFLGGCGGHKPGATSPFPTSITLIPTTSASLQQGGTLNFSAAASSNAGAVVFNFHSSDTSILNFSPSGVACAGRWDALFTTCTPQGSGVVSVTASALGATSPPTMVFVHPAIDTIEISVLQPTTPPPPACPGQQLLPASCALPRISVAGCLSANQQLQLQAKALSQGVDITPSVGPFTWSSGTNAAVGLTPIVNTTYNLPTNEVLVAPGTPGFTPVFATSSGASSAPYYVETCPVQCVSVDLDTVASGRTNFTADKGATETVVGTAVDVQGCLVPKPALTWSSSQPGSVLAGSSASGCAAGSSCEVTTPSPGAGTVTASCTPPACNLGFPMSVAGLTQAPQPALIPADPVYAVTPITGFVSGAAVSTSVLAGSFGCSAINTCTGAIYSVSTSKNISGTANPTPIPPNSLMLDPAGDKAYMGSDFGAAAITVSSLGGSSSAFSSLGSVTGRVLAVSPNGNVVVLSETVLAPNRVYVVTGGGSTSQTVNILNIYGASAAAFSPDGLKVFIFGYDASGNPNLYVFSALQALQKIALPASTKINGIAFSSTGAFAYVSSFLPSGAGNISVYDTCDNHLAQDTLGNPQSIPLPVAAQFLQVLPDGKRVLAIDANGQNLDLINYSVSAATPPGVCPQFISNTDGVQTVPSVKRIPLQAGPLNLVNLFVSPDTSQLYIVAGNLGSILVYSFNTGSIGSGIPLAGSNNPTPVQADITVDGTLIYVIGSDGLLHEVSTTLGDLNQISFPNLPNSLNPFCSEASLQNPPCSLDFVAVKK